VTFRSHLDGSMWLDSQPAGQPQRIMGSAYPDLYAAVGVHSGLACGAARDMPSPLLPCGKAERLIPVGPSSRCRPSCSMAIATPPSIRSMVTRSLLSPRRLGSANDGQPRSGSGGISYTRTVECDESGHPMLEHWVLHGAGHAWSGGSPNGPTPNRRARCQPRDDALLLEHPKPIATSSE
jgi:hypothetical protein